MPRQPRLDAPGLLQHVMARGIERREIFKDDKDRKSFLGRFADILEETQTQCYAWALIPNHFHILLRTGPTPLSKVMRRLMTGYAVTFNKRHKRSGHLFQNRYKSVICEEDPYLLELIRYIHLNPLRASLVKDLKELDNYPWTGHSTILGRRKNPLLPAIKDPKSGMKNQTPSQPPDRKSAIRNPQSEIILADRTIQDVLLNFGKTTKTARKRYREFVEKGIKQGTREDLQGGGLVRSAGGETAGLLGRKAEEREKGDARILGSGDFVSNILKDANDSMDDKVQQRVSLDDLISRVCSSFELTLDELVSKRRKREISRARAVLCYLAVDEMDYSGEELARILAISGRGVSDCRDRGKIIVDNPEITREYLS